MRIKNSIYEKYLALRVVDFDDENVKEMPQKKWYDIAMQEKTEEFNEILKKYERLKDMKFYQCLVNLSEFVNKNIIDSKDVFEAKAKYDLYDAFFDVEDQIFENKNKGLVCGYYDELVEFYQNYVVLFDDWTKLVWMDKVALELLESVDNESLGELVEDMNYYNSVRSNPDMKHIIESKKELKRLVKWIKTEDLDVDTKDLLKEYAWDVKDYLDILTQILTANDKIKKKDSRK